MLTLKKSELEDNGKVELPKGFVNVSSRKGKWVFETMELVRLSYIYLPLLRVKYTTEKEKCKNERCPGRDIAA